MYEDAIKHCQECLEKASSWLGFYVWGCHQTLSGMSQLPTSQVVCPYWQMPAVGVLAVPPLAHAYKIVTLVTHVDQSCGDPVDKPALQPCYPQHLRRSADRFEYWGGVCIKYLALILWQGLILCTAHLCYVRDLCTALCLVSEIDTSTKLCTQSSM